MTLPPCPCCGLNVIRIPQTSGRDYCVRHPISCDLWALKDIQMGGESEWKQVATIYASGLRATGAKVHENYEKWEKKQ